MVVLAPQIATLLFDHGHSSAATVGLLGLVLAAFAVSLVPFTGYMIMMRGFYALQDTRTSALITTGVSATGVAGCLAAEWLLPPADIVVGVPIAYAAAYTVGLVAAAAVLRRRLGRIDGRRLLRTHVRVLVAAAAGAACVTLAARALAPVVTAGWTGSMITVGVAGLAGIAGYLAAGRLLHLTELRQLATTVVAGIRPG
jgi:putative peptidoglycan lipid II flippase